MRYWKCVGLNDKSSNFTLGRVYESDNNGFGIVNGDGVHMLGLSTLAKRGTWNAFNTKSQFTEVCEQDYINQEKGFGGMEDLKELLKVGYIVKVLYEGDESLCHVMINSYDELILSGEKYWARLDKVSILRIIEVYDRVSYNTREALKLNTRDRKLIWKRTVKSPTQLKLEELKKKQREIADEMEKLRKEDLN